MTSGIIRFTQAIPEEAAVTPSTTRRQHWQQTVNLVSLSFLAQGRIKKIPAEARQG